MGAYLSSPKKDKDCEDFEHDRFEVGCCSMQGWRVNQEDAHCAITNVFDSDHHIFGVFDGHGGPEVSKYCAKQIKSFFEKKHQELQNEDNIGDIMQQIFVELDKSILEAPAKEELAKLAKDAKASSDDEGAGGPSLPSWIEAIETEESENEASEDNHANDDQANTSTSNETSPEKPDAAKSDLEDAEKNNSTTNGSHEEKLKDITPKINGDVNHGKKSDVSKDKEGNADACSGDDGAKTGDSNDEVDVSRPCEGKKSSKTPTPLASIFKMLTRGYGDASPDDEEMDVDDAAGGVDTDSSGGPGVGSGTTAVVAYVRGNRLYVANAGDSRCILSRAGKAVELSFDHKPDDDIELKRIKKAGGNVFDGRVNCGLNLSRAIGDHSYKRNQDLDLVDQMITAFPDIESTTFGEKDEFMVLACDGIWNCMDNQEVIDFVRSRLLKGVTPLSSICAQLFDHCLAPDTHNDGTGCDNMTAIIVRLKGVTIDGASSDIE